MSRYLPILLLFSVSSCFLFRDYRKSGFTYMENGEAKTVDLLVPKKYTRSETRKGADGRDEKFFYYPGGPQLYFARVIDTTLQYMRISYGENIPKQYLGITYFKGFDSSGYYWRESRVGNFRAGYVDVGLDNDGLFDSSVNHFIQRIRN